MELMSENIKEKGWLFEWINFNFNILANAFSLKISAEKPYNVSVGKIITPPLDNISVDTEIALSNNNSLPLEISIDSGILSPKLV